jgi:hypothetical protein
MTQGSQVVLASLILVVEPISWSSVPRPISFVSMTSGSAMALTSVKTRLTIFMRGTESRAVGSDPLSCVDRSTRPPRSRFLTRRGRPSRVDGGPHPEVNLKCGSSKPLARQFGSGLPAPAHRLLDKGADLDQHSADLPRGQGARRHLFISPEADPVSRRKKAPKHFPFMWCAHARAIGLHRHRAS